jgi:hypothetical protein
LTVDPARRSAVVWERNPNRARAPWATRVDPDADTCRDYPRIYDVSGDASLLDTLIARLAPGGEIVLAGFYSEPLSFAFPPPSCARRASASPPNGASRPVGGQATGRVGPPVARRIDHPSAGSERAAAPTAPRSRSRLPEDDSGLENCS